METKYFMLKDSEPTYPIFYAVSENKTTVAVSPDPASPFITCYDINTYYDINVIEDYIEECKECTEQEFLTAFDSAEKNIKEFFETIRKSI